MTNANARRTTIGVIGKNEQHANDPVSAATMQLAHEIGRLIAAKGGVVVTGGLGGVMSPASRGAGRVGCGKTDAGTDDYERARSSGSEAMFLIRGQSASGCRSPSSTRTADRPAARAPTTST